MWLLIGARDIRSQRPIFKGGGGGAAIAFGKVALWAFTEYYYANLLHFMFESSTGKSASKLSICDLNKLKATLKKP